MDAPTPDTRSQPDALRLDAMDEDDLKILSALCQDAVLRVADVRYVQKKGRFAFAMNRFRWEKAGRPSAWNPFKRRRYERRRSVLDFARVVHASRSGVPSAPDAVLDLLAVRFEPGAEPPAGTISLVFAGGATIRLDVECVEARLTDGDAVWEAGRRPEHGAPER